MSMSSARISPEAAARGDPRVEFCAEAIDVCFAALDELEAAGDAGLLVERHHVRRGKIRR
jgi:hypothetical protein